MNLPYTTDYAKSNRSRCKGCKSLIEQDTLRLALMVQSPKIERKIPSWYHFCCFFTWHRPETVDDVAHFESLRWEDQEKIKSEIKVVPQKRGQKRAATATVLSDFTLRYSTSNRAECQGCKQNIMDKEVRISKKRKWYHLTCFAKLRLELGYFECGDQLPGFQGLTKDVQEEVEQQLPAINQDVPHKKPKLEDETDGGDQLEQEMRSQNILMFSYYDELKALSRKEHRWLLKYNRQQVYCKDKILQMLNRLADNMTFGALERCRRCQRGQFEFDKLGFKCNGNLTEWSKCGVVTKEPKRRPFLVPSNLAEKYSFLKKYKYVPRTRLIRDVNPSVAVKNDKPKIGRECRPLYNMEFVIVGNVNGKKNKIKKQIVAFGGKVIKKINKTVMAVISTAADVEAMGPVLIQAMNADIPVVPQEFLDEVKEYSGRIPKLVMKKIISHWGTDPAIRFPPQSSSSSKSKTMFTKAMALLLKGGVNPDSGLADCAHVYQSGIDKYTAVLGVTDIQQQKNSYYILQLLQSDSDDRYWLFRSWGRIGTAIGDKKPQEMSLDKAKKEFCRLYKEKSGNRWSDRANFVKVPGRLYPIDVDYGDEEAELKLNTDLVGESKLCEPVQQLIKLIFDINSMKEVMLDFDLDTVRMPLGMLSKSQIQKAYLVLSELQQLLELKGSRAYFIDASNRFYTHIPHSFGVDDPPIIDNIEMLKQKIDMVENLMELEIAYSLMKSTGGDNTIDAHYDKLKAEINILDRESEEFKIIQEYVKNTHAATHSEYELEIEDVFTVKRQGEEKQYEPFSKLHNRMLLWHGSRVTNFAGILSQGLRIAPPEAPMTGYMFGKGLYFADMVSKSANYCFTSRERNTGLLLLCEVALGEMQELENAEYVEKLPKDKHSVKGVGRTEPDPENVKELPGGVHVPVGKGIDTKQTTSELLYNEYIVYDVAQVNIKYLLKMNFKYKENHPAALF